MRLLWIGLLAVFSVGAGPTEETVVTAQAHGGAAVPYVLDRKAARPRYVVILFPGDNGRISPHLEDGLPAYSHKSNFLLQARRYLVDDDFATVAMDATDDEAALQAVIDDLHARLPGARVYLAATSRGTLYSMRLAPYLSDKIDGVIHTSSMADIVFFDARKYKNRQLLVANKRDTCRETPPSAAERAHEKFGDELILMDGGVSEGDPCQPKAYHGFHGIRQETVAAIKAWIKRGGP